MKIKINKFAILTTRLADKKATLLEKDRVIFKVAFFSESK
jgi:hypothetical protein